tara:strand:- start:9 stop:629 length:621 start_codon:yes stop_codon:yes gene_type:complete
MKECKKKYWLLIFILVVNLNNLHTQDFFEEFDNLIIEEKPSLLPDKMIITQRLLWGDNGLLRKLGVAKLNIENREEELILREKMLKTHQILGYVTFAGMIAQGIIGGKLYNGDYSLYETHKTLGKVVSATYFTGAGLSIFSPPPLISREKEGLNNIKVHKILANIHVPAMIMTNVLSDENKKEHRAAAYTAFASYTLAMVSIIIDF